MFKEEAPARKRYSYVKYCLRIASLYLRGNMEFIAEFNSLMESIKRCLYYWVELFFNNIIYGSNEELFIFGLKGGDVIYG